MGNWNKFKHILLDGEYAKREKIIKGLTPGEVTNLPAPGLHTIYDELWHTAKWQHIVIHNDEEQYKKWDKGERYPSAKPISEKDWNSIVNEFLSDLNKALVVANSPDEVNKEVEPGVTMGDCLDSLAIHNAYHLGKIVALRQMIGAWPPKE